MSSSESEEFEIINQLEASLSPEELAEVQEWLQSTDYEAQSSEFHRHLSSQAPGTGLWICETSKYQQWQESSEHGSLWIKGVPGAGKSVTAASMIQHLQKTEGVPVLSFFFRYIISANRRPRSLVRDFLAQLLPFSVRLQATLQPLIGNPLDDFSDEILWEYLLTGLSSVGKAYCIIDALDEMELLPKDSFLARLNNLATFRPKAVKLLMTSRPKQYLQSSLRDTSIVHISLEDDLVGHDIALFLSHRTNGLLPGHDKQELRKSLVSAISERSDGLFLYARLLLDQIIPNLGSKQLDVEKLVESLPVGLEEMYNSMLFQQAASLKIDIQIQVFLLELATHSSRALRLNEMASVLSSAFPASMMPDAPKAIARSACAPLLEILEDETVSVIHHSFTEFLLNHDRIKDGSHNNTPRFPVLSPDQAHKKLSVICMNYLGAGGLRLRADDGVSQSSTAVDSPKYRDPFGDEIQETDGYNYQESKLRYPFLEYAVGNWAFHASNYDFEDDEFYTSMANFLDPDSLDFKKWLKLEWMKGVKSSKIEAPTPLHIASFAGLTTYAKRLLEEKVPVDPRDAEDRTPLHWACARGHTSMASLLLKNGASANSEDIRGVKPIHEAARRNHAAIVNVLLEAGVHPLTPKTKENVKRRLSCGEVSTKGETAVEYAWLQGHTDTIAAMLPFLTPETLEELFCQCCRYGKFEAVRAILKATDVSPNSKYSGATALYLACRAQSVGIVELLLAKGADVHQTSEWEITNRHACGARARQEPLRLPIHGVVMGWKRTNNIACQQILCLLLNAGADIEAKDTHGDTTLLFLFGDRNRHKAEFAVVSGILQAGANVLAVDEEGDSVLHRCLQRTKDVKILKLLFEYGARADVLGKGGDTLLHTAMTHIGLKGRDSSMADVINLLLNMGTRCDVKNNGGITAIEYAAGSRECDLETFTSLLRCADAETIKRCMWKLSKWMDKKDTPEYIRVLQKFGVSLEDRDSIGATVLLTSAESKELFSAFIECGADLKAVDSKGRGVLHYYISSSPYGQPHECLQRLEEMVDMGLDPMHVDYEGNNLLHLRAKIYKGDEVDDLFIQKLLDYGISVKSKNNEGMTPLHVHLNNWDANISANAVQKRLDERFHERHEIPLLNLFRRNKEAIDINAADSDGVTVFHLAALRSETRMYYLLGEGADPTLLTKKGRNGLHLACRARQSNVIGYLCQSYPILLNQQDEYGRTPLHDACTSGQPDSVRLLLNAGADITITDKNKRTPLHACAEFPNEQRLWELLMHQNDISGQVLHDRFRPAPQTPLAWDHWYALRPHSGDEAMTKKYLSIGLVVKQLLSAGSDVMADDSYCQTPLDLALQFDCQGMIQVLGFAASLLSNKHYLKPEDRRLSTLLALKGLNVSPLSKMDLLDPSRDYIFRNLSTYLPFLTFDDIEWIAKNGGNITGFDEAKPIQSSGQSLLHIAASNGLTQLVESFGALACFNDDPKIVTERIHERLSIDTEYDPGFENLTPILHVACAREAPNMEIVEALVTKCGVDVNARTLAKPQRWANIAKCVEGGTALHVLAKAQYSWQLEAINYLLQEEAKIDAVDEKGETPLHIACTGTTFAAMNCRDDVYGYWRIEVVKILLQSGANINILDKDGLSCLHKASSSPQIMRILLEHGADLTAGKLSPVFSAIQIQCLETLTILLDAGVSPNIVDLNTEDEGFQLHYKAKNVVRTALFCASFSNLHNQREENSATLVKLLIERGADIYAALNGKQTLLHYVSENAEFEIVSAFLDCASKVNIDFNTRDSLGRTVFIAACEWVECLPGYQHKRGYPKETAPFLRTLDFGADPRIVDNEGRNALHHLLDNPEMEEDAIIQFLAHDSAKDLLHRKDGDGFTPLNCALRFLRPAVVEVMITMGVNLLSADPTGATALHRIAEQCLRCRSPCRRNNFGRDHQPEYYTGALALWKKFLSLGGSINVRDNKGAPPLFYFLSSAERDQYDAPEDWCCHLQYFATYFYKDVTKVLDFGAKNMSGENALHVIARREKEKKVYRKRGQEHDHVPMHDKELYQFFMRKGLNPLEEDGKGRSSLDVAAACEQKGILELFQYGK